MDAQQVDEFIKSFQRSFLNLKHNATQLKMLQLEWNGGMVRFDAHSIHYKMANIISSFLRSQKQLCIFSFTSGVLPTFKIAGLFLALATKNSGSLRTLIFFSANRNVNHLRLLNAIGQFGGLCHIAIDYDLLNNGGLFHLATSCTQIRILNLLVRGKEIYLYGLKILIELI